MCFKLVLPHTKYLLQAKKKRTRKSIQCIPYGESWGPCEVAWEAWKSVKKTHYHIIRRVRRIRPQALSLEPQHVLARTHRWPEPALEKDPKSDPKSFALNNLEYTSFPLSLKISIILCACVCIYVKDFFQITATTSNPCKLYCSLVLGYWHGIAKLLGSFNSWRLLWIAVNNFG